MYFPYLKTKQNEMKAISELFDVIQSHPGKITPILDPVKLKSPAIDAVKTLCTLNIPFIFLVNPQFGDYRTSNSSMEKFIKINLKDCRNVIPGYSLRKSSSLEELSGFLDRFRGYQCAVLHRDKQLSAEKILKVYRNNVIYNIFFDHDSGYNLYFPRFTRVLIKDGFIRAKRNADYPPVDLFISPYKTYTSDYSGFGDFQIVGDIAPRLRGGPAHACALHFTFQSGNELNTAHFISDDTTGPSNIQLKYHQALKKMIDFTNYLPSIHETLGLKYFKGNLENYKYPGNNIPKKNLIKHHIELVLRLI